MVPESFIAKMTLEPALKNCSQEYTKKKTQAEDLRQESIWHAGVFEELKEEQHSFTVTGDAFEDIVWAILHRGLPN